MKNYKLYIDTKENLKRQLGAYCDDIYRVTGDYHLVITEYLLQARVCLDAEPFLDKAYNMSVSVVEIEPSEFVWGVNGPLVMETAERLVQELQNLDNHAAENYPSSEKTRNLIEYCKNKLPDIDDNLEELCANLAQFQERLGELFRLAEEKLTGSD